MSTARRSRTYTERTPDEIRPLLLSLVGSTASLFDLMSKFPCAGVRVIPDLLEQLVTEGMLVKTGTTYRRR